MKEKCYTYKELKKLEREWVKNGALSRRTKKGLGIFTPFLDWLKKQ